MTVSIIIVNFNLAAEIENCLNSLLKVIRQNDQLHYEIIIVDNNSPERDIEEVEKKFSNEFTHFFYLEKNVGFGKGCNYGFSKSKGDFLCFLNPDTILEVDIFTPFINLLLKDETIGIISPKQQTRKPFFDFSAGYSPKLIFEIFNLLGIGVFIEGAFMYFKSKSVLKPINVNWILGACIVIRSDLFSSVNGFDEDYFMFFEEVDLCKRVLKKGFKVVYNPDLSIHHIGSVSGKKNYRLYTIRTYSSKFIYLNKHLTSKTGFIFKSLLYIQLISQLIIWTALYPFNIMKSKQKISAFWYLLKNNFSYYP